MVFITNTIKFKGYEYDGDLINNKPNGFGILYYKNKKCKYIGFWKDGKKNGEGTMYYNDGRLKIKCNWIDNRPNGLVIYYDFEGNRYEYQCNFGIMNQGKCCYTDSSFYIGSFKNNLKHGFGRLYNSKGVLMFEGNFKNNLKDGYGKMFYSCSHGGLMFDGNFRNDKFNGSGVLFLPNGAIFKDQFKDNRLVNKIVKI
jgi:antitoxin component YwqK of YwqJK toxin-antitoxin module